MLGIVQGVLNLGETPLIEMDLGKLVTFDIIFDAIEQEVQAIRGSEIATIHKLSQLGEKEGLPIQSVAKALYLLQQVGEWLPTTPENIAAVLYPRLGENPHELIDLVRKSLTALAKEHYVSEREGRYQFLSELESSFEREVEKYRSQIPTIRKQELARDIFREKLRPFQKIRHKDVRDFEIKIEIDEAVVYPKGHITLRFLSPLRSDEFSPEDLEMETARQKNLVYFLGGFNPQFEEDITYVLALERVLDERRKKAPPEDEKKLLREKEKDLDMLRYDKLPSEATEILRKGVLIYKGGQVPLGDKDWEAKVRQALNECISETFYEFERAAVRVREDDILKIFTWKGGTLPEVYRNLQVVDSSGQIREDSPLLSGVLSEIRRRVEIHDQRRSGRDLEEFFSSPPYGWDLRVLKLSLAALLVRGSISVISEGKTYTSQDTALLEIFKSNKRFSSALFDLGVTLTPDEEKKASILLAELFGEHNKVTPAEIWESLKKRLQAIQDGSMQLLQRLKDLRLGGGESLGNLQRICDDILESGTPEIAIKKFIEDEIAETLRRSLPVYRRLSELHEAGKLERAAEIRRFSNLLRAVDPQGAEELDGILSSDDFPMRWDTLFQTFKEKEDAFRTRYIDAHRTAAKEGEKALKRVREHRAFHEKADEAVKILERNSIPFECQEEPSLTDGYVCSRCRVSIVELLGIPDEIRRWEERVREALEGILIPEDELGMHEEEFEIRSVDDLKPFEAKIRAFVRKAMDSGRKVQIYVKMEER